MKPIVIGITGTDTGVGKTVFAAALTQALDGYYYKPVQAGLEADVWGHTDGERVAHLAGLPPARILPEMYRLTQPLSPHRAAELDELTLDVGRLAVLPHAPGPLVVEGAGGVLVPLSRQVLQADVFARWGIPMVVCARTGLGTLNHTLLTLEALAHRQVPVLGLVFIGPANPDNEATACRMGKVRYLGRLAWADPLSPQSLKKLFMAGFHVEDYL